MTDVVSFNRALADPTRWRIVSLVMEEAMCVCELADILEMPQSTLSSHVQIIRKAGLLESEKREKWTYFRIDRGVLPLVREIARHFEADNDAVTKSDARKERIYYCLCGIMIITIIPYCTPQWSVGAFDFYWLFLMFLHRFVAPIIAQTIVVRLRSIFLGIGFHTRTLCLL